MKITILHISDLHRDLANPISNNTLLDSLERDRVRYRQENPPIGDPNLIVVSGDVIYGILADSKNPDEELAKQYEQAEEFLAKLADSFVHGYRDRVVIVPGNHDVSASHTLRSMKRLPIDPADPATQKILQGWLAQSSIHTSLLRWSWKELCFFEINDERLYHARLNAFSGFYEKFYRGSRSYKLEPDHQCHIFDYPELRLSIAALSSCCNNDPLNRQGLIHPDCIARVARELRQGQYASRIHMAVWHHNTSGPPLRTDYMDSAVLQVLIDSGFSIGFHGHQHKAQFIDEKFQFGSNRKITVVSAGTLCAGPKALPPGHARAYNLVEIDTDTLKARLHTRTMQNESFEQPIWGPGHFPSSMTSFVEFEVQLPNQDARASIVNIGEAEMLVRAKQFAKAIPLLKPLASAASMARRLLLECYVGLEMNKELVEEFYPPSSDSEIIYLADALWDEKNQNVLEEMLKSELVRTSSNPTVSEIVRKYNERLKK
jgi:hypothetical protein